MICQKECIAQLTLEAENQQQNKAKNREGHVHHLGAVMLHKMGGDKRHWFYSLERVCKALDHVARCKLGWQTSKEHQTNKTPDTSMFCFCWWQPVWHCNPNMKFPSPSLKPGCFLGIACSCGDKFTCHILNESQKR